MRSSEAYPGTEINIINPPSSRTFFRINTNKDNTVSLCLKPAQLVLNLTLASS